MRVWLGKAKGILNYEIKEITEVNRKAVVMVNLKDTIEGDTEEVN